MIRTGAQACGGLLQHDKVLSFLKDTRGLRGWPVARCSGKGLAERALASAVAA
jgi:hypothetical protein